MGVCREHPPRMENNSPVQSKSILDDRGYPRKISREIFLSDFARRLSQPAAGDDSSLQGFFQALSSGLQIEEGEEKASQRRPSLPDIAVLDQIGACPSFILPLWRGRARE